MSETYWEVSISFLTRYRADYYAPWGGPVGYARAMANARVRQAGVTVPDGMEPKIIQVGPGENVARWEWFG